MSETEVITFGCRLNAVESATIETLAREAGLADVVVINTCAVTAEAVRQTRQAIRKLRREQPEKKIVVTGCAAQIEPDTYARMPEVDAVLGNQEKLLAASYANLDMDACERIRVNDIMSVRETALQLSAGFSDRARAFLQIQNGCDHRCTFCIIPYGRGNSRSVAAGEIVEQAHRMVAEGFSEIVLTGVDLTAYGADLPGRPTLGNLVRRLLKLVPELPRLRLSSFDVIEADPELMRAIAEEERLMPHFHLSVQSGDDLILKRMKRRHSRRDTIRFCETVRGLRPGAAFGADLIAGFPTETEGMFENTRKLIADAGLSYLHVFPYSARKGTPAARMPQLDRRTIKSRAARLRAEGRRALHLRLSALEGTKQVLLVEKPGFGRTACFAPARLAGGARGALVRVRIAGASDGTLDAVPLAS